MTITQAIRRVLSTNEIYLRALQMAIANYTALAERIKPEVERLVGSTVNVGTVIVVIKRLADSVENERLENQRRNMHDINGKEARVTKNNYHQTVADLNDTSFDGARMSLTDSIVDIGLFDIDDEGKFFSDKIFDMLEEILDKETRYSLFQTNKHLRLFAEDITEVRNLISVVSSKFDHKINEGLSRITITLPATGHSNNNSHFTDANRIEDNERLKQNPYNIMSKILNILYNNNIPLHDAFLTPNEIVLIMRNKDAARAYEIIRSNISG
ncbi:MAG: hypothetical protein WBP64_13235 [Nitrososphaeraceae archaeon]